MLLGAGIAMLSRLLPQRIDNSYAGSRVALWLFGVVVALKGAMAGNAVFNGYVVAASADGIPLDTYPLAAARTVVSLFALWGVGHLVFSLLGFLVLARYRAMVPLMFVVLLVEQLGRRLVLVALPITRPGGAPGSSVNLGLFAVMIVGLGLSLWNRGGRIAQEYADAGEGRGRPSTNAS
jgi:hypothetical protein